jgi:hypothetical protein
VSSPGSASTTGHSAATWNPRASSISSLGLTWYVTEILDRWEHPGNPWQTLGKPDLIKWWLLKVSGPLPDRPAERGEFVMDVSA